MRYIFFLFLIISVTSCNNKYKQIKKNINIDSIAETYNSQKIQENFSDIEKFNDSLKIRILFKYAYKNLNNPNIFLKSCYKIKSIDLTKKDSSNYALVNEYLGYYHNSKFNSDSTFHYYYKSYQLSKINSKAKTRRLIKLAQIQNNYRDYTGSEINIVKALNESKLRNDYESMYYCYRSLARTCKNLKKHEESVNYNNKALKMLNKFDDKYNNISYTLNGIGVTYMSNKEYEKSIGIFNKALKKKKFKK